MLDNENTTQNPTPEENSIPPSPQEPTADAPILPMDSEPANVTVMSRGVKVTVKFPVVADGILYSHDPTPC